MNDDKPATSGPAATIPPITPSSPPASPSTAASASAPPMMSREVPPRADATANSRRLSSSDRVMVL